MKKHHMDEREIVAQFLSKRRKVLKIEKRDAERPE